MFPIKNVEPAVPTLVNETSDTVFFGAIACVSLEDIYAKANTPGPQLNVSNYARSAVDCYALHIDATCDTGKGGNFRCLDGWTG